MTAHSAADRHADGLRRCCASPKFSLRQINGSPDTPAVLTGSDAWQPVSVRAERAAVRISLMAVISRTCGARLRLDAWYGKYSDGIACLVNVRLGGKADIPTSYST